MDTENITVIDWEERANKYEKEKEALKEQLEDKDTEINDLKEKNEALTKRLSDAARLVRSHTYSISKTTKDRRGKIINEPKTFKMELVDIELSNLLELLDGTRYE